MLNEILTCFRAFYFPRLLLCCVFNWRWWMAIIPIWPLLVKLHAQQGLIRGPMEHNRLEQGAFTVELRLNGPTKHQPKPQCFLTVKLLCLQRVNCRWAKQLWKVKSQQETQRSQARVDGQIVEFVTLEGTANEEATLLGADAEQERDTKYCWPRGEARKEKAVLKK